MAAAGVEQKIGHKKVADLLGQPPDPNISSQDRALLGAAWVNAIRGVWRSRCSPQTLLREDEKPRIAGDHKNIRNNSNRDGTQVANVDVRIHRRNAFCKSFHEHANGYADVEVAVIGVV